MLCSCLEEGFLDSARNDGSFFVFLVCSCFGGGISRLCSKWQFFFRFFGLFLFGGGISRLCSKWQFFFRFLASFLFGGGISPFPTEDSVVLSKWQGFVLVLEEGFCIEVGILNPFISSFQWRFFVLLRMTVIFSIPKLPVSYLHFL